MYPGIFSARIDRIGFMLGYVYSIVPLIIVVAFYIIAILLFKDFAVFNDYMRPLLNVALYVIGFGWVVFYPLVTVSLYIRRLHDLGYSGWLTLLSLVPLASMVLFLYLLFAPGKNDGNKYGAPLSPRKFDTVLFGPHPSEVKPVQAATTPRPGTFGSGTM